MQDNDQNCHKSRDRTKRYTRTDRKCYSVHNKQRNSYIPNSFALNQKRDNGNKNFVNKGNKVVVNLSAQNTIVAQINGSKTQCLIDTGALGINLIDFKFLTEVVPNVQLNETTANTNVRVANGQQLPMVGSVSLSLLINDCWFRDVNFGVARDLSHMVILGSKFLNTYGARINCSKRVVTLNRNNQLRIKDEVIILKQSQSLITVNCSTNLPSGVVGLAQGGRNLNSLGLMVANTVTKTMKDNKVNVLLMNPTVNDITLFARTKLGMFTLIDPEGVEIFDNTMGSIEVNSVNVHNKESVSDEKFGEILSQIKINSDSLTSKENQELKQLISEFQDVFKTKHDSNGNYSGVEHEILTDHPPIRSRPYRQSPKVQEKIRHQVNDMLEQGVIRESTSPWSFPVCMIPKAGSDNYRFCIDFRKLNQVCDRCNFPLPNINDTLDSLGSSKPQYFSTLDLAAGYWQINLSEKSKEKSAFITQDGLYEFNVMPFGLHNAPATFQRAMHEVFRGLHWKFILIYLDDIIVFSSNFSQHLQHLREVFMRLRAVGLKLQPKKCSFACKEVKYLGHVVTADGVKTDPDKTKLIRDYPTPTKVTQVRSFLGLVGYYRKFVKDFCKIAEPLTNLTRKDVSFVWSSECQSSFQLLKNKLMQPSILVYPKFDGTQFILQTDASIKGLGFILAQVQNQKERVIAYGGRALSKAEKNYTITELEALAVVEGIKKYRPYFLQSEKFKVVTDHCALKWLFTNHHSASRLVRWSLQLQAYSFEVVHVKGKHNSHVDALSRMFVSEATCLECRPIQNKPENVQSNSDSSWIESSLDDITIDVIVAPVQADKRQKPDVVRNLRYKHGKRVENQQVNPHQPQIFPQELDLGKFKEQLKNDVFAKAMIDYLDKNELPEDANFARDLILQADQYFVRNELLYHVWYTPARKHMPERNVVRLYIPKNMINLVLTCSHDHVLSAHFGFHRTYDRIRYRYFWKGMYKDVDNWVRSCVSCAQRKTHRHKVIAPMVTMKVPGPFERVSVDVLGPLPITVSGNRYVLCFTDHCTRWPILVPLPEISAATVARVFFEQVICVHGCPVELLSDRGTNFLSRIVYEVCRIMQTNKVNTSSYHPQTNAIQERFNSVILDTISHYVNDFHSDWDKYLPAIQFAYRTTPATNSVGFSPFFLLYGREAKLPLDVTLLKDTVYPEKTMRDHIHGLISQLEVFRSISKAHAEECQAKMKEKYDERAQDVEYQVGDCVWIYIPQFQSGLSRKLLKLWCGPYLLVEKTGPVNFRVRNLENNKLLSSPIHVNRMKFAYDRYIRPDDDQPPRDATQATEVPGLEQTDCPQSSFEVLLGTKESDQVPTPILGVPAPVNSRPDQEYDIERVLRGRYRKSRLEYLIKWKGFPSSANTWEPVKNLNKATRDDLERNPVRITGKK